MFCQSYEDMCFGFMIYCSVDWLFFCQVNPAMVEQFEHSGMRFVGHDDKCKRMEIMELQGITLLLYFSFCECSQKLGSYYWHFLMRDDILFLNLCLAF